jgi:hypothetical protein
MLTFTDVILIAVLWVNSLIFFLMLYPHIAKLRTKHQVKISYANSPEIPMVKTKLPRVFFRNRKDDFYDKLINDKGGE